MFMSEDAMIVGDALNRIDAVLQEKPLPESFPGSKPEGNGISLEHVATATTGRKTR
mgnify:CR=1 FL=1